MRERPRAGATATSTFVVDATHTIDFGPPVPPALSTPSLIWHLEHAAIDALKPFLAPDEISLGTGLDLQHPPAPSHRRNRPLTSTLLPICDLVAGR